jgi:hypothetical protein
MAQKAEVLRIGVCFLALCACVFTSWQQQRELQAIVATLRAQVRQSHETFNTEQHTCTCCAAQDGLLLLPPRPPDDGRRLLASNITPEAHGLDRPISSYGDPREYISGCIDAFAQEMCKPVPVFLAAAPLLTVSPASAAEGLYHHHPSASAHTTKQPLWTLSKPSPLLAQLAMNDAVCHRNTSKALKIRVLTSNVCGDDVMIGPMPARKLALKRFFSHAARDNDVLLLQEMNGEVLTSASEVLYPELHPDHYSQYVSCTHDGAVVAFRKDMFELVAQHPLGSKG